MDNLDKKLEKIFKENVNVPENFELTIKNALTKERVKNMKKIPLKAFIMIVLSILIICGGIGVYPMAKEFVEYQKFKNREVAYSRKSIETAIANGHIKDLDMEYNMKDGIGVKIDEISLTSDSLVMQIKTKLEKMPFEFDPAIFTFEVSIIDENKNVYWASGSNIKNFYKEQEIEFNENDVWALSEADSINVRTVTFEDNVVTSTVELDSTDGFSEGKKLFIRISEMKFFKINYEEGGLEETPITDVEYLFEIDLPEEFYNRNEIQYVVLKEKEGFELVKATVSETGLVFAAKIDGLIEWSNNTIARGERLSHKDICIIKNEKGEKYECGAVGVDYAKGILTATYDTNILNVSEKLYVHILMDEEEKVIELVRLEDVH